MIPGKADWSGMAVFAERDGSVPVVHLYINLLSGVELDPPGASGLTRLAAQMLRMGTSSRSRDELNRAIEALGAELDVSTSHHRVIISGHVISDNLDPFLDLLDEVLNDPGLRADDFEKLRRETLADIVQIRDDDQSIAYRNFRSLLFGNHAYGRSALGRHRHVSSMEWEHVRGHVDSVLGRARVIIGLAGDFDADHMRSRLVPVLESFTDSTLEPPVTADPRAPRGLRVRLVDKPGRTQSQIYMGHLGLRADEAIYFPVALLNTAFGGTFTARLSREVRQKRGWSYGAYSRILRSRRRDAFYLWTFPALENMVECTGLELEMLESLEDGGLSQEEFDFARKYLDNHFLFAVETASLRVALALRQEILGLPADFYARYRQCVRAVTFEQVGEAARAFVDPANLCICALCTADQVMDGLEELLGQEASIEVVPYDADV